MVKQLTGSQFEPGDEPDGWTAKVVEVLWQFLQGLLELLQLAWAAITGSGGPGLEAKKNDDLLSLGQRPRKPPKAARRAPHVPVMVVAGPKGGGGGHGRQGQQQNTGGGHRPQPHGGRRGDHPPPGRARGHWQHPARQQQHQHAGPGPAGAGASSHTRDLGTLPPGVPATDYAYSTASPLQQVLSPRGSGALSPRHSAGLHLASQSPAAHASGVASPRLPGHNPARVGSGGPRQQPAIGLSRYQSLPMEGSDAWVGLERDGSGPQLLHRDGSGLPHMQRDGSGLPHMQRDGSGLQQMQRESSGLQQMQRESSGLQQMQRDGSGLQQMQRDGSGLPHMQREGSGLPHMQRDGSGLPLLPMAAATSQAAGWSGELLSPRPPATPAPSPVPSCPSIEPGELELQRMVGEGGFARVYQARWRGQEVAVKLLNSETSAKPSVLEEFRREVAVLASLGAHPNVLRLVGACTQPPYLAVVTEFCSRGSLYALLHSPTVKLSWGQLVGICLGVARGMQFLHAAGVLHRDLKSGNLLLQGSALDASAVKLADFGLSRMAHHAGPMTGGLGTFQWMAPEVLGHQRYSTKADVYSFAMVMWECAARRIPYTGMDGVQAALAVMNRGLRPEVPPHTPEPFACLMRACWAPTPDQRPDFGVVVAELERMASEVAQQAQQGGGGSDSGARRGHAASEESVELCDAV